MTSGNADRSEHICHSDPERPTSSDDPTSEFRFINGRGRTIAIIACGEFFWLLMIGGIHSRGATTKDVLFTLAVLVLGMATRGGFSFVLILGENQVTARTLTRTRSWHYGELRAADLAATPRRHPNRAVVMLCPVVGRPYRFATFEGAPEVLSEFDCALQEINARILCARLEAS